MIVLPTERYAQAAPLFSSYDYHQGHFGSVLTGMNPGRVFVDRDERPRSAALLPDEGFLYLAGEASGAFVAELAARLRDEDAECVEAFWADSAWSALVPALSPDGKSVTLTRMLYRLPAGDTPSGAAAARALAPGEGLELRVESSPGRLAARLTREGRALSSCSAWVYGGQAEMDIETAEEERGKGYARLAAGAFLAECARLGLEPQWNCWDFRQESNALAERLGFRLKRKQPAFLWDKWL